MSRQLLFLCRASDSTKCAHIYTELPASGTDHGCSTCQQPSVCSVPVTLRSQNQAWTPHARTHKAFAWQNCQTEHSGLVLPRMSLTESENFLNKNSARCRAACALTALGAQYLMNVQHSQLYRALYVPGPAHTLAN